MKIALVGASGFVGSKILAEAVERGHSVAAICRHPENIVKHDLVSPVQADVTNTTALARAFQDSEAVIHSYAPPPDPLARAFVAAGNPPAAYVPADPAAHEAAVQSRIEAQTRGTESIIEAARAAGVTRILAVGGAGTLLVNGVRNLDQPNFPKAFEGGAKSTAVVKEILKQQSDIDWTVLCPPMMITPGTRTGKFRLGGDELLVAPDGSSRISVEDYAVAMIDELESPRHSRHRFTIAY